MRILRRWIILRNFGGYKRISYIRKKKVTVEWSLLPNCNFDKSSARNDVQKKAFQLNLPIIARLLFLQLNWMGKKPNWKAWSITERKRYNFLIKIYVFWNGEICLLKRWNMCFKIQRVKEVEQYFSLLFSLSLTLSFLPPMFLVYITITLKLKSNFF